MKNIEITAKHITPVLQFGGLGLLVYGVTQGSTMAGAIGILAALVGGVMWKTKREDAEHEARKK